MHGCSGVLERLHKLRYLLVVMSLSVVSQDMCVCAPHVILWHWHILRDPRMCVCVCEGECASVYLLPASINKNSRHASFVQKRIPRMAKRKRANTHF